jgi:hypothetical protein
MKDKVRYHLYLAELAQIASANEARVATVLAKANMLRDQAKWQRFAERSASKARRHLSIADTFRRVP